MAGAAVPQRTSGTILVVSADPQRRDSVARFLEWELPQARILIASNPDHAVLLAGRERIDLLLVDGASDLGADVWGSRASTERIPRVYLADDPRGITDSKKPGPRPPDARPLNYRGLLAQVQRILGRLRD